MWFPVWWYTTGFLWISEVALRTIAYRSQQYGLRIWLRNFFVPMYGQYDIAGRLVSVFMRSVVLLGRCIALAVESAIYAVGVAVWCVAPPMCIVFIVTNVLRGAVVDSLLGSF